MLISLGDSNEKFPTNRYSSEIATFTYRFVLIFASNIVDKI